MHGSTDSQDRRLLLKHVTYFNGDLVDAIIIHERPKGTLLIRLFELIAFALDLFFELFLNREDASGLIGLKVKGFYRA